MNTLDDQSVFVSGSAKGIGKAIAAKFIEQDANVIMHSRSESGAIQARDEIKASEAVWGDLASAEGANQVLGQLEPFAPIEILINNAGNW